MGERVRAHVFVSGRVQGVFFRQETWRRATARGAGGWVRNLADGRVEAVFEGPQWVVDALVAWSREGPRAAAVSGLEISWERPVGEEHFRVR